MWEPGEYFDGIAEVDCFTWLGIGFAYRIGNFRAFVNPHGVPLLTHIGGVAMVKVEMIRASSTLDRPDFRVTAEEGCPMRYEHCTTTMKTEAKGIHNPRYCRRHGG